MFSLTIEFYVSLYLHQHVSLMPNNLCAKKEVWSRIVFIFLVFNHQWNVCVWHKLYMHAEYGSECWCIQKHMQDLLLLKVHDWNGLTLLCKFKKKKLHYNSFSGSKVVTYIPTDKVTLIGALYIYEIWMCLKVVNYIVFSISQLLHLGY